LLEALITSKTRLKLLTKFFLNHETQAYLQELATEFGESSNGIRLELNHLTEAKLLTSQASGRTIVYQANKAHGLFDTIQDALRKNLGIDRVVELIIKRCGHIEAAWIVGDYARGVDSGLIDVVVLGKVNYDEFLDAIEKTSHLIDRKIRYAVLNDTELKKLSKCLDMDHALPIWNNKQ
jgi:hypothetical protein